MAELEPETRGPLLAMLAAALDELNPLNHLVAYSPGISNRSTHLDAIQDGIDGLVAAIPDVNPLDPPVEPEDP